MPDETQVPVRREPPFGAPNVIALAVVAGPAPYSIHRVSKTETIIGRADTADYIIDDSEVSGHHVAIEVVGSVYTVIDLNARNGTLLNGKAVDAGGRARLRPLDEIVIGKTRLLFTVSRFRDT